MSNPHTQSTPQAKQKRSPLLLLLIPFVLAVAEAAFGMHTLNDASLDPEGRLWGAAFTSIVTMIVLIPLTVTPLAAAMRQSMLPFWQYAIGLVLPSLPNALFQIISGTSSVPILAKLMSWSYYNGGFSIAEVLAINACIYLLLYFGIALVTYPAARRGIGVATLAGLLVSTALVAGVALSLHAGLPANHARPCAAVVEKTTSCEHNNF